MLYEQKNKNLLLEIQRISEIMGLSLITEQGVAWLDNLINAGSKRITNLDDIIKKLGLKGKNLTDADIDKIVDEIPVNGKIKDEIRQVLKNDVNVKNALKNNNENFLLQLKKSKNASAFNEVANLTADEVNAIVKRTVSKMLNDSSSKISKSFDNYDDSITEILKKTLSDESTKIRNVEEIYDFAESRIQGKLNKEIENGMDMQVANEIFERFRTKLRTDSKLKTKLDEISSSGRNSNLRKRTKSIPNFNSKVDLPEELLTPENWLDDLSKKVKDSSELLVNNPIDNLFKTNTTYKKKFQKWVRKVLYQGNTKKWNIDDLNLTEELKNFIEKYDPDFYKNLKDENYKSLLDDSEEWDALNMLDTNNKDGKEYLNDLLIRKKGKKDITQDELYNFLDELEKMTDDELKNEFGFLKQNKNKFTQTSSTTSRVGELTETYFIEDLLNLEKQLSDNFELVYHAGENKGNPIDTILGIDLILKNKKTNELVPVQIKKTNTINIKPSKINPDQDSFSFWLSTPIRLKDGYGVVIDNKNNFVMFGPQMQYKKVNDQWLKTNLGFNKKYNINYVDIDLDGNPDFITNIPF